MAKTKAYTKKAIDNYRSQHDFINLTMDLGIKERLKNVGIDNKIICSLIIKELEKREKTAENSDI